MIDRPRHVFVHSPFAIPHSPFLFGSVRFIAARSLAPRRLLQAQATYSAVDARNRMVDDEIVNAGIEEPARDRRDACHAAPRVRGRSRSGTYAYFDMALPIGEGQTISPPFIVAYMTEQLDPQPTDKVLEIGTGSGYQAAILSPLVKEVYSIEIKEPWARTPRHLEASGLIGKNVFTKIGDGYQGWPEHAPFDKIIVTCSPENVPQALVDQLRDGGRMIVPLGERFQQTLYLFRKEEGKLVAEAATGHAVRAHDRHGRERAEGEARSAQASNHQRQLRRNPHRRDDGNAPRLALCAAGKIVKDPLAPEGRTLRHVHQ